MDILEKLSCFSARTYKKIVLCLNAIAVIFGVILLSIAVSMEFIPDLSARVLNSEVSIMRLTTAIMVFGAFEFFVPIVGVFIVLIQSLACLYFYIPFTLLLVVGEVTMLAFVSKMIAINNSELENCKFNACEESENLAGKLKGSAAMFSVLILVHIIIIFSTLNFTQEVRIKELERRNRKSMKQRILDKKSNMVLREGVPSTPFPQQSGQDNAIIVTSENTTQTQQKAIHDRNSSTRRSFTQVVIHHNKERIRSSSFRTFQHPDEVVSPETVSGYQHPDKAISPDTVSGHGPPADAGEKNGESHIDASVDARKGNRLKGNDKNVYESIRDQPFPETGLEDNINQRKDKHYPDIENSDSPMAFVKSQGSGKPVQSNEINIFEELAISNAGKDISVKTDYIYDNYPGNKDAPKHRMIVAPYIIHMNEETEQKDLNTSHDEKLKNTSISTTNISNNEADILYADEVDGNRGSVSSEQDTTRTKPEQFNIKEESSDQPTKFYIKDNETYLNYDADLSTTSSEKPSQFATAFEMFSKLSKDKSDSSGVVLTSAMKIEKDSLTASGKDTPSAFQKDGTEQQLKLLHAANGGDLAADGKKQKTRPDTPLRLSNTQLGRLKVYTKHGSQRKAKDEVIPSPSIMFNQSFDEDKLRPKYPSKKVPRRPFSMFPHNEKPSLRQAAENPDNLYEAIEDFPVRKEEFERSAKFKNYAKGEQPSPFSSRKGSVKKIVAHKTLSSDSKSSKSKTNDSAMSAHSSQSKEDSVDSTPSQPGVKAPNKNIKKMKLVSLYASLPGVKLSPLIGHGGASEPEVSTILRDITERDVTTKSSDKSETTFFGDMSSHDMFESMAAGSFWRDSAPDQSLSSAAAPDQSLSFADSSHIHSLHQEMKALTSSIHSLPELVESHEEVLQNSSSPLRGSEQEASQSEQKSNENATLDQGAEVKQSAFGRSRLRNSAIDPNIAERITMSLSGSPKSFYL